MLMKIYFEMGESDPLFSHFDAFKTYLRRNKVISKYQHTVHANFIKFTKKAYQLKMKADWARKKTGQKQVEELLEKINQAEEITPGYSLLDFF